MDLVALKNQAEEKAKEQSPVELNKISEKVEKDLKPQAKFAKRIETFNVKYLWQEQERSCIISSKIMDHNTRAKYDRVLAELTGGLNFDNLPYETKNRYICIARVVSQIVDPPEWFLEAVGEDLEFCYTIGGKLLDHESRFFRYNDRENDESESRPRFSIS
jgi:hypothetical protein